MNRRSLSRVLALGVGLLIPFVPAAVSTATPPVPPPAEAYPPAATTVPPLPTTTTTTTARPAPPPAAVVNLIDPFGCAPTTISGDIGAVLPGSTVTLQLLLLGGAAGESRMMLLPLAMVTVTAAANGHAIYSIPVPQDRFGPVVVRATGTNTLGQPFAIETTGTIVDCPALPPTGNSGLDNWLRGAAAAVLAGVALVVVAMRRRRHAPIVQTP